MLACPLGVVIVDDELIWRHVRQTVLLQGKVPGDWCGRFRGRLFLTIKQKNKGNITKPCFLTLIRITMVLLSSAILVRYMKVYPILQSLGTPKSLQWWFIEDIVGRAVLAKDLEVP